VSSEMWVRTDVTFQKTVNFVVSTVRISVMLIMRQGHLIGTMCI
jgi:hypothetical protein